jgi:hypothetical protein
LLGFEKAFNLIDWEFLFSTLKPLGFNGICGKWISSLYIDVVSSVKMNGELGT